MKHLAAAAVQDMLWLLVLVLAPTALVCSHLAAAASGVVPSSPPPVAPRPAGGCDTSIMCGNVRIPYPFGISQDCALPVAMNSGNFTITCNSTFRPPKPFIGNIEIVNISLEDGQMVVRSSIASICYNSSSTTYLYLPRWFTFSWPYLISPTSNEFTAIGCDTEALLANKDLGALMYFTGCISFCGSLKEAAKDGDDCVGLGCCKTGIVANLDTMRVFWGGDGNTPRRNNAWNYSPCSYAFMAKKGWYKFSQQDLTDPSNNNSFLHRVSNETVPLVVDWAIRNGGSCLNESGNLKAPACVSNNSTCVNATNGVGYLCNCTTGYTGNPYIPGGCTNIDECTRPTDFPCHGVCKDTDGSYECKCPAGYESDGDPKEKPCHSKLSSSAKLIIGITVGASVLFFVILGTVVCYMLKRIEQKAKERELEAIERKNGSERLKNVKTLILFTKDELDKITMNNLVPLGKGGYGEVHKGILSDKTEVAVKASNEVTKGTLDKFVEEVEIQSRMMHRNILKLLGCCLRVDVPLLVYEYAAKGSLKDILHGKNNDQRHEPLTLSSRLDIAIGSAQGLAYMHSYTENGIQHADVKPDNILLDGGLVPKISDFGLSKVSVAGKDYTMNVIGCLPYMDPVYKDTGRLTPKSDVYSFGIVLLELISRRPVVDGENSLVKQFKSVYEQYNTGKVLFDQDIVEEQDIPILDEIGKLAMKCLKENVNERPAMASVASALVILKDSWEETRQKFSSTSIN